MKYIKLSNYKDKSPMFFKVDQIAFIRQVTFGCLIFLSNNSFQFNVSETFEEIMEKFKQGGEDFEKFL